ncbi:MAG: flavodoxin domain-containing protein [Thermodesulfobacteriota bacterium]|nr:flavodoxin domain-containing protein [Thermodesulfobacteriota bacterium]
MKTLLIYVSVSHANTKRIAKVMAGALGATLLEPEEVDVSILSAYDLIGFGSGIYFTRYHNRLREFMKKLPVFQDKKAFLFATSGMGEMSFGNFNFMGLFNRPLKKLLLKKGFDIIGIFFCTGHDTCFPFNLFGGVNKGRPDAGDFKKAEEFAENLKGRFQIR